MKIAKVIIIINMFITRLSGVNIFFIMFKIKYTSKLKSKYIIVFIKDRFKSICFFISQTFIIRLTTDVKNKVIVQPQIFILFIDVNINSPISSKTAIIIEFLRIIVCLFIPFRIPNIVVEAKKTGEKCPECGSDLVIRKGRYGSFVACSNFPTCKYVKNSTENVEICNCPKCDGKIIEKKTRKGKLFYGCNNYPTCKEAYWDKPTGELCPKCNSMLVDHKGTVKCSACDYTKD